MSGACSRDESRGVRLSDATVPNEAVHQRGKPSLVSLVYLHCRVKPMSVPKMLAMVEVGYDCRRKY